MNNILGVVKKNTLLSVVLATYLAVLVLSPDKGLKALQVSGLTFLGVALIILAVFILIGLFQVWTKEEAVVRHLGHESGAKGLVLGALLGTALNGPLFSVFPLIKGLLNKGAKVGVIAVIFATYAIKVPMIPLEIAFLGLKFAVVHNSLMFLSAFLMAPLMEWMMGDNLTRDAAEEEAVA
jgi:uncharacterized membrane protein YraQ (UPF0718 family)